MFVGKKAVCQHRRGFAWVWESAPRRSHTDGNPEHEEKVGAVVGIRPKVLGTKRTAVLRSNDTPQMQVAEGNYRTYNKQGRSCYISAVSPGMSAVGLPDAGPAGSRYLQGEMEHLSFYSHIAKHIITDWYDREFDSIGPGMSTSQWILRNVCIRS